MVEVGQEVECVVLSVDQASQKIALGIKQTQDNPWDQYMQDHSVGDRITGKVQHLTDYGAFVNLSEGIDGLLHIQDLSWPRRFNHPSEFLNKGDDVEVQIISADPENRKIGLSIKALGEDPWPKMAEAYPAGTEVDGKVTKIASFGLFVEIDKDLDGLVHLSELPVKVPTESDRADAVADTAPVESESGAQEGAVDPTVQFLETQYHVGDPVHAQVLRVDEDQRRIALSLK